MLASPNDVLFRPAHIQLAAILEVELQRCFCVNGAVLRKAECMYRSLPVCCSLRSCSFFSLSSSAEYSLSCSYRVQHIAIRCSSARIVVVQQAVL